MYEQIREGIRFSEQASGTVQSAGEDVQKASQHIGEVQSGVDDAEAAINRSAASIQQYGAAILAMADEISSVLSAGLQGNDDTIRQASAQAVEADQAARRGHAAARKFSERAEQVAAIMTNGEEHASSALASYKGDIPQDEHDEDGNVVQLAQADVNAIHTMVVNSLALEMDESDIKGHLATASADATEQDTYAAFIHDGVWQAQLRILEGLARLREMATPASNYQEGTVGSVVTSLNAAKEKIDAAAGVVNDLPDSINKVVGGIAETVERAERRTRGKNA